MARGRGRPPGSCRLANEEELGLEMASLILSGRAKDKHAAAKRVAPAYSGPGIALASVKRRLVRYWDKHEARLLREAERQLAMESAAQRQLEMERAAFERQLLDYQLLMAREAFERQLPELPRVEDIELQLTPEREAMARALEEARRFPLQRLQELQELEEQQRLMREPLWMQLQRKGLFR